MAPRRSRRNAKKKKGGAAAALPSPQAESVASDATQDTTQDTAQDPAGPAATIPDSQSEPMSGPPQPPVEDSAEEDTPAPTQDTVDPVAEDRATPAQDPMDVDASVDDSGVEAEVAGSSQQGDDTAAATPQATPAATPASADAAQAKKAKKDSRKAKPVSDEQKKAWLSGKPVTDKLDWHVHDDDVHEIEPTDNPAKRAEAIQAWSKGDELVPGVYILTGKGSIGNLAAPFCAAYLGFQKTLAFLTWIDTTGKSRGSRTACPATAPGSNIPRARIGPRRHPWG